MRLADGIHDITIEEVDHSAKTFAGYCYLEGAPDAIFDALRLDPNLNTLEFVSVSIEGDFSVEWVDGEPNSLSIGRCFLIRAYRDQFGNSHEIRVEVVPYDVFGSAGEALVDQVMAGLDIDGARHSRSEGAE